MIFGLKPEDENVLMFFSSCIFIKLHYSSVVCCFILFSLRFFLKIHALKLKALKVHFNFNYSLLIIIMIIINEIIKSTHFFLMLRFAVLYTQVPPFRFVMMMFKKKRQQLQGVSICCCFFLSISNIVISDVLQTKIVQPIN